MAKHKRRSRREGWEQLEITSWQPQSAPSELEGVLVSRPQNHRDAYALVRTENNDIFRVTGVRLMPVLSAVQEGEQVRIEFDDWDGKAREYSVFVRRKDGFQ